MKFRVASGSARESLWHEPGLGSGICTGGEAKEQELNKQIAADSTKEDFSFMLRLSKWDKNSINFFQFTGESFARSNGSCTGGFSWDFMSLFAADFDRQWCPTPFQAFEVLKYFKTHTRSSLWTFPRHCKHFCAFIPLESRMESIAASPIHVPRLLLARVIKTRSLLRITWLNIKSSQHSRKALPERQASENSGKWKNLTIIVRVFIIFSKPFMMLVKKKGNVFSSRVSCSLQAPR